MSLIKDGNWGLKLLALILALVIYHALKNETAQGGGNHDRKFLQSR